ncbi:hypothetical protein CVT25_002449, partial [Psilocybe cyanescens]
AHGVERIYKSGSTPGAVGELRRSRGLYAVEGGTRVILVEEEDAEEGVDGKREEEGATQTQ